MTDLLWGNTPLDNFFEFDPDDFDYPGIEAPDGTFFVATPTDGSGKVSIQ